MGYITVFTLYTTNKKQIILPHGPLFATFLLKLFAFYIHNTMLIG